MATGRRALFLAIAGLVISGAAARAQESRAESRPDSRLPPAVQELQDLADYARRKALEAYDAALDRFHQEFLQASKKQSPPPPMALYLQLRADADNMIQKLESPQYEAKMPEQNLLSVSERSVWRMSRGAKLEFKDGAMIVEWDPIQTARLTAVASVVPPRASPWHDLSIDLEFTILSGSFDLYLRYWPEASSYMISFGAPGGWEPDRSYRMTIRIKGSFITLTQDHQPTNSDTIVPTTSLTGGIALGVKPGSKVSISKLNLKVLR